MGLLAHTWVQDRMGARQHFEPAGSQQYPTAEETASGPAVPDYVAELEQLARLRDQGIVSADEFEAKKKQLLGV